jgi:predicted amidohydrolase
VNKTKIGLSICYDLRFPELYRLYAKEKVDVMINIANWPVTRIEHWKTLLKARAIENQFYMIGVNRTGDDPQYNYCGATAVFDPLGNEQIMTDDRVGIFEVKLNLDEVNRVRTDLPFLNDMKLI